VLYWLSGLTCTDENMMQKADPSKLFKLRDMVGGPSAPLLPTPLCEGPSRPSSVFTAR